MSDVAPTVVVWQGGVKIDRHGNVTKDERIPEITHETAGTAYDSGAGGYELQGRAKKPHMGFR